MRPAFHDRCPVTSRPESALSADSATDDSAVQASPALKGRCPAGSSPRCRGSTWRRID